MDPRKDKTFVLSKSYHPEKRHTFSKKDWEASAEIEKHIRRDEHNLRFIGEGSHGGWFYLPKDHPEYKEHPGGSFVIDKYMRPDLEQFGIDMCECHVVEHTLLALADVKEMPSEGGFFYDPAQFGKGTIDQLDELERKKPAWGDHSHLIQRHSYYLNVNQFLHTISL